MNSELYGKVIDVPDDVVVYLEKCFNSAKDADETTDGYKRNRDIRDSRKVTYQQLNRMKNWFDNFNGFETDFAFVLNGGHYVRNWVEQVLKSMRDDSELGKEIKSVVLPNQYNQSHERTDLSSQNRPSQSHRSTSDYYNTNLNENILRINDLINKTN